VSQTASGEEGWGAAAGANVPERVGYLRSVMTPAASVWPLPASPPQSPLLDEHLATGATLTSFAGWTMPLRFGSELAEHRAVRESVGLFDLSHMAQLEVAGPGAAELLDFSLVSAISPLAVGRARYTMMTSDAGGVLDDLVVYRIGHEEFLVVANAANREVVLGELERRRSTQAAATVIDGTPHRALIAVQGPASAAVVAPLVPELAPADLRYYGIARASVAGVPALVARTGYTGEDGFELSVPADAAATVWNALAEEGASVGLLRCGLASRDTLRLEAGMALYGRELTPEVTPYDVGLGRLVHLDRDFVGRSALARRAETGGRSLVGLRGTGRRAARSGSPVVLDARQIGTVTSGALSPTLGYPIAMALVVGSPLDPGSAVVVDVRGTPQPMEVVTLPFYRRPR
jgi:aminomethyltransferase